MRKRCCKAATNGRGLGIQHAVISRSNGAAPATNGRGFTSGSVDLLRIFLALAAGAIIYVVAELLGVAKRFKSPELVMWGLLIGFLLGYVTDLLVTFAGA